MFDVWKNVMVELEQEIPHASFITWFKDVELIGIEDGVVKISTKNPFIRSQIEARYDQQIKTALKNNDVKFSTVEYVESSISTIKKHPREVTEELPKKSTKSRRSEATKLISKDTGLNPKYTLSSFVTGSNNDLAVEVAKSVIEHPGEKFNPFFLYGGPGLGKTHLVQAIGNELLSRNPSMKILYTPVSHFYSEFIDAIKKNHDMETFRKKFRKLDVLIIDDFQFIVNKEKSQQEFFDIFNDLHQNNKQIIITSDRLPNEIEKVDERLASRLTWAGAIDMQAPSFEDKCAIIKSKAEFMGVDIEDEAVEYLAESIKTNIRDLEGALNRLITLSEMRGMSPLETISTGNFRTQNTHSKPHNLTPKQIVSRVAKYYNLSTEELKSKSRVSNIKNARQVAMYLLSKELSMSSVRITSEVGVSDHTTVMHGVSKIEKDLDNDYLLRNQITELREQLYV